MIAAVLGVNGQLGSDLARMHATALDDIRALFQLMPEPSRRAVEAVEQRQRELTKPTGSLGRLEELVAWLAGVALIHRVGRRRGRLPAGRVSPVGLV